MKLLSLILLTTFLSATLIAQKGVAPAGIPYENRTDVMNAPKCNPSEAYLKKKVKAQLATYYEEYPYIAVDFTSFKGQHGYTDKNDPKRIVYPFKIEMLVYLKRPVMKEGKEHTEYVIWKYDCEYEYASRPKRKCDFAIEASPQITLITRQVY